jgi:hypothetical protein
MEAGCEFRLPLVHQVWRTQYGALRNLPTVEKLAKNESCFDGFADTDIIGDQQPHHRQTQCHQQWNDLVGAWFHGDVAEGTERTRAVAKFEVNGVAQEGGGLMAAVELRVGKRKCRRLNGGEFEFRKNQGDILFGASEGAQQKCVGFRAWLDNPFAIARTKEGAGSEISG